MAKPPAFQVYAADEIADGSVLTLEEIGGRLLLKAQAWRDGWIPSDPQRLARILRMSPEAFATFWAALDGQLEEIAPGRLVFPEIEEQRRDRAAFQEEQRKKALRGWDKRRAGVDAAADAPAHAMAQAPAYAAASHPATPELVPDECSSSSSVSSSGSGSSSSRESTNARPRVWTGTLLGEAFMRSFKAPLLNGTGLMELLRALEQVYETEGKPRDLTPGEFCDHVLAGYRTVESTWTTPGRPTPALILEHLSGALRAAAGELGPNGQPKAKDGRSFGVARPMKAAKQDGRF